MKIRNGFVSNSSSSSFIVRTDGPFKTVYDVAKFMMKDIPKQWGYDSYNYSDELKELEAISDKDTPVFFDTTDGGYIRKFKDYIIVTSTMHYSPTSKLEKEIVEFNDVGEEYFKELEFYDKEAEEWMDEGSEEDPIYRITDCEDFDYYWKQFNDFLVLKSGLYGVWDYDFEHKYCDCGRSEVLKMKSGEIICRCKATKKLARKLKLEKIKEDENS